MYVTAFVHPAGLDHAGENLKLLPCPHCRRVGMLIHHGYVWGRPGIGPERTRRARRFFCSNRRRRHGCGRTFSVYRADVLPGFSLTTSVAWLFLSAVATGASLEMSYLTLPADVPFSWSTLLRFWRRFRRHLPAIRSRLVDNCRLQAVAPTDVTRETIRHLTRHLHDPPLNPVAVFQLRFHKPFLSP